MKKENKMGMDLEDQFERLLKKADRAEKKERAMKKGKDYNIKLQLHLGDVLHFQAKTKANSEQLLLTDWVRKTIAEAVK
jgi:predicted HicB family RNase H-like nuclease